MTFGSFTSQRHHGAHQTSPARGAEFLTSPVEWDHGEIRAFFRDPDGHLFEVSEVVD